MDLITRRVSAKNIGLPEWAIKVLKEHSLEDEVEVIRKGITPEDTKFKESERSSVDYITTKTVDRDGEIVVPSGAVLDHYRKHPVVLFGHNYKELPIGKSLWIKSDDNGLISKTQYAKHRKADDIYQYRKDGFPMAKSIGFIPLEIVDEKDFESLDLKSLGLEESDLKGASRVYPLWLMLEYSDVPIPSNPDALQLAISKGILTLEEAKTAANKDNAFVIELVESEGEVVNVEHKEKPIESEAGVDSKELEKRHGLEIIDEASAIPDEIYNAIEPMSFKSVKGVDGAWNPEFKDLDIVELEAEPSTALYDIASKWLDCEVKDIFVHKRMIPSAEMGSYITGLEEALKDFDLITARNFMHNGTESPLEYGIIQLTSERSSDFLVEGMEFYDVNKSKEIKQKDGNVVEESTKKIIIKRSLTWYGFQLTAFSTNKEKKVSIKLFSDAQKWANENNFLKGECFSLSGEFLKKTEEDWPDLFLESKNETVVKRTTDLINEKGADLVNRGLIFMGPPGTGKTLSGRIIRNKSDVTFIWISARDFIYAGSVGGISYGFSLARKLAPSILLIEDVDNWLDPWTTDLMKTEMDGMTQSKGVVTMLTSNYPELLPAALIDRPGRFHDVLNFSLPNAEIRIRMVKAWTEGVHEKILDKVIKDTRGFSGAHIYELVSFAKTIMGEDEITIDDALIVSLQKIIEQRELIESLGKVGRKGAEAGEAIRVKSEELSDHAKQTLAETLAKAEGYSEGYIAAKAGKVLSKETRKFMQLAIDHMSEASTALNELFDSADKETEIEEVEEVEVEEADSKEFEVETEKEEVFEVDSQMLASAIADTFKATLSSQFKVDAGDMVNKSLAKAKGEIY